MAIIPKSLRLHRGGKHLDIEFADHPTFSLSSEYLRVHSPSAEVKGHGPGQEVLQWGKIHVTIKGVERAGNYAIRIYFDDGHDTGIYSWDYLYELAVNEPAYWQAYLDRLEAEGKPRDPDVQIVRLM